MSGKTEGDPYKLIVIIHCLETLVQMDNDLFSHQKTSHKLQCKGMPRKIAQ